MFRERDFGAAKKNLSDLHQKIPFAGTLDISIAPISATESLSEFACLVNIEHKIADGFLSLCNGVR